eukprot:s529_g7.t1
MATSKYTELYPAKFARAVIKTLLHEVSKPCPVLVNESEEHPTKKRRLSQKLSPAQIASRFSSVNWQTVMHEANRVAPRVGGLVVEQGPLLEQVKEMCPDHDVKHVVLCRGTDRCVGPNKHLQKHEAPLRKRICIRRHHETVEVTDEWEPWERLTQRALRRKSAPARVSLTIFASVKVPQTSADAPIPASSQSVSSNALEHPAPEGLEQPLPKRLCPNPLNENLGTEQASSDSSMLPGEWRQAVDLVGDKHGPEFLQLSVKAMRCSTCHEQQGPRLARPAALHTPCDFGSVVSMDAVKWTNQQGQQFLFYHFVDQSTAFQTAVIAPSNNSAAAIQALIQGWISWAGPPGLLCVDSATELNSEEFSRFLHKFGIPSKTIAPEAHWQNAKAERHGGILQQILNRMDQEEAITDYDALTLALAFATHTKNQWSRHRGYPPELLVLGKTTRVAGSVISDSSLASHSYALEDSTEGLRFREELAMRERARKAFAAVDNQEVLRRALVHRSRPLPMTYNKGDWVMIWKRRGESDGQWQGPMQVVLQEGPQVMWVTASDQPDTEPSIPEVDNQEVEPSPHEVPIPDDADDLVCEECWHVDQDQAWCFEVNVCQQDIDRWRREENPHEMAFLVSAAKRQRAEVRLTDLNAAQKQQFVDAKNAEIDSWLSTGTVMKVLRNQIPLANILRCRWILSWKDTDEAPGSQSSNVKPAQRAKARLVVLGYEDPQVDSIPRDSPTMSKLTRMLILQLAASNHWLVESFDIKTAFLRGQEQKGRNLGLEPPSEMRQRLNMHPGEVLKLLKGAYGRVDAPFLWFQELQSTLLDLGFRAAPFDPCSFILSDDSGATQGIIGVHVDDGLCAGSEMFQAKLLELSKRFPFGSRKQKEFIFTGLHIKQHEDFSITVDQTQYIKDIHPISLTRERRLQQEDVVNEKERQQLGAIIGSLQYGAVNTRPDLCARLGWLQSQINKAQVATLIEANRVLHEAKEWSNVSLWIQPIAISDLRFVAFSDASFASEKTPDSHQGMIIMAAHKDIGNNKSSIINPICWHSKKIQRVAVSTLSAEAMALSGAVDCLSWVRLYWAWLIDPSCDWRNFEKVLPKLPPAFSALPPVDLKETSETFPSHCQEMLKRTKVEGILTTDCKSLHDLISRTATPACQEFRTVLQAKLIKEHLQSGIHIRWVSSSAQVADALTKIMDCTVLRTCLKVGRYSLHDESEILRARSDRRAQLQWLQQQASDAKPESPSQEPAEQ